LARLLSGLFAGITCEDSRLGIRVFFSPVVDDLETRVFLLQRIIAKQQIEIAALETVKRIHGRDRRFDVVAFLGQYQTIRRKHRTLIIYYEYREFAFSRHVFLAIFPSLAMNPIHP